MREVPSAAVGLHHSHAPLRLPARAAGQSKAAAVEYAALALAIPLQETLLNSAGRAMRHEWEGRQAEPCAMNGEVRAHSGVTFS